MALRLFNKKEEPEEEISELEEIGKKILLDINDDGVVDENDYISDYGDDQDPNKHLEIAKKLIEETDKMLTTKIEGDEIDDPKTYLVALIESNMCATIGIKMEYPDLLITAVLGDGPIMKEFKNFGQEEYMNMCEEVFKLDITEQFNCSRSVNFSGVKARVYAVMPPLVEEPNITISTTKTPPSEIPGLPISDQQLDEIVHSNFIVCGASGSGKTYFTNFALSKFIKQNERIAFVEEFSELIPPNPFTISIITPPAKPGQKPLLQFVTEQSNLMRLDAVYVGEVKGPEAFPMIVNMASGTRGGCTLHGDTPRQALSRLRVLCQLGTTANPEAIDEFISKSINYIIQMRKHKVIQIVKLKGSHIKGNFSMESIYSNGEIDI